MFLTKEVAGVPIYNCESPAEAYRYSYQSTLKKEISLFLDTLRTETLLRGIYEPDLDLVAKLGSDSKYHGVGTLIYVVPYKEHYDVSYPFSIAKTGLLIYKASGLTECYGDGEMCTGMDFNRYQFEVYPKEALLGIIDLREVKSISKTLKELI